MTLPIGMPLSDLVVTIPIAVLSSARTDIGLAPCTGKIVAAWVQTTTGSTTTGSNVFLLATTGSTAGVTNGLITLSSGAAPNVSAKVVPSGLNGVTEGDSIYVVSSGVNSSGTGNGNATIVIRR
jgi:hypothetical protein